MWLSWGRAISVLVFLMLRIVVRFHGCYSEPSRQTLDTGKLRSEVLLQRGCSTQAKQTAVTPGVRKVKLKVVPCFWQSCCVWSKSPSEGTRSTLQEAVGSAVHWRRARRVLPLSKSYGCIQLCNAAVNACSGFMRVCGRAWHRMLLQHL